ncbi:hypothetical protein C2S52_008637 [Perilla frutescens var. hirtella]|nr:hypothetical protein C2S52_008637 [Perilla frutescens var. hirtella]
MDVTIRSYSQGHIDCMVKSHDIRWRFMGFYGNPDAQLQKFSWTLLRKLAYDDQMRGIAWLMGGDFNEVLYAWEKDGGCVRPV